MGESAQAHRGEITSASELGLEIHPEAILEIEAAIDWYDSQQLGLGAEFVDELAKAFELILEHPKAWPIWVKTRSRYTVRRFVIIRFPFAIGYTFGGNRILIVAVAHARRQPIYWLHRLKP